MFAGRYVNLLRKLDDLAARTTNFVYLEVGTFNGVRAANLLDYFLSYGPNRTATYIGFDLFSQNSINIVFIYYVYSFIFFFIKWYPASI